MQSNELQTVEDVEVAELLRAVDSLRLDGWRIVQILCVAAPDGFTLYYSFGGGLAMRTLKAAIGPKEPVPSITPHFPAAFLYENEIRDLFGVRIEHISLDWEGDLISPASQAPFSKLTLRLSSSERPDAACAINPMGGAK